jgi:hypothetical protein
MHEFVTQINLGTGSSDRVFPESDDAGTPTPGMETIETSRRASGVDPHRVIAGGYGIAQGLEFFKCPNSGLVQYRMMDQRAKEQNCRAEIQE